MQKVDFQKMRTDYELLTLSGGGNKSCSEAQEALKPYRVENAVIMAAGLSSRFAPLSYEKPKGLTRIKGEVLIERQIRQLHEAGIEDITVVVGYKAQEFEYLAEKFGVDLVFNGEYASRNNHASLWLVADRLSNTYICSSDNYFDENPFHAYEWKAGYSTQFVKGSTEEWCLQTDESGRITDVEIGGKDAWIMIGPAYFDRTFSDRFRRILRKAYPLEGTRDKLWESLFLEHIEQLDMEVIAFDPPVIREFDRIDEALAFDPEFLQNADSGILDRIVCALGCQKTDISELYPLKAGLTNLSCHFRVGNREYVYRHPGVGTELLVNRAAEFEALAYAKSVGVDGTYFAGDAKEGWKISYFIPNSRQLDAHNPAERKQAMEQLRILHQGKERLSRTFDFLSESRRYESLVAPEVLETVDGYQCLRERVFSLLDRDALQGASLCITHNDFFSLNILLSQKNEMHVIDWEYAGMGDYANDYGTFVVTSRLCDEEAERALTEYFGRKPTREERIHNFCYVAYASWCWYVWAILKEAEGDRVGDWRDVYRSYAAAYCKRVEDLLQKDA